MVSKVYGIVIKETDTGESGKRITVVTRERGRMVLSAKGSKSVKSSIMAAAQLFSYCEFTIFEGRGFYSVTQADVIESFYGIRNDFERLAYAAYILEITDRAAFEELENQNAFELLLRTLFVMSAGKHSPRLVTAVYIIRLLKEFGLMGDGEYCSECGVPLNGEGFYTEGEGIYCANCTVGKYYRLNSGALKAISHITQSEMKNLFSFRLSDEVMDEIWNFADINRRLHLGEWYKTLDYINNMHF